MANDKFSRRRFLSTSSAAAAGAGLSGCAPEQAPAQPTSGGVWKRPPDQTGKGNRRNLIYLSSDTFRADNLQCYGGNGLVHCPRLDAFSESAVVFENCYPEGMPTIPIRRVIMTGRRILPYYTFHQHEPVQLPGWHELYYEDQTVAETLTEAGYMTALIADIPHMQRPGKNFHRGYSHYDWVRGHEFDYYGYAPRQIQDLSDEFPASYLALPKLNSHENNYGFNRALNQFKSNRARYIAEGVEALVEVTAKKAIAWLKANHDQGPFFLHVEAFDPHEPWDPPKRFLDQYMPNAGEPNWYEPPYAKVEIPPEGVARFRANYAGESMCVDYWLGEILKTVEELGLYDNSVVAFFSDHGALLGEQDEFLKGPERMRRQVIHNPLLIRTPGNEHAGRRVPGFLQHPDMMPTLFSLLELDMPERATGRNAWPLVSGETTSLHEHVVLAYGWIGSVRTEQWQFSTVMNQERYGKEYPPQLYNRETDPDELTNVAEQYPEVVADLTAKMRAYLAEGEGLTKGHFHAVEGELPKLSAARTWSVQS